MAKHPRRRGKRRFNLRRVRITPEEPLLTLASDTVITQDLTAASPDRYRCVTVKGSWTLIALTAGEGPITVGYAHSDYSVTEIKECLEAQAAISQSNKVAREQSDRLVRVVGTMRGVGNSFLNDGKPISTKLNWLIGIGATVKMFSFNESTSPLTTGAVTNLVGDMWIRDI